MEKTENQGTENEIIKSENTAPDSFYETHEKPDAAYLAYMARHTRNVVISIVCCILFIVVTVVFWWNLMNWLPYDGQGFALTHTEEDYMALRKAEIGNPTYGKEAADGESFHVISDGMPPIVINRDDIEGAVLTPDKKHLAYFDGSGTLMFADANLENIRSVGRACKEICHVTNEGVIYKARDSFGHLCKFDERKSKIFCYNVESAVFAKNALVALCVEDDGTLYICNENGSRKIEGRDVQTVPLSVSGDGKVAVWSEIENGTNIIKDYDGGEVHAVECPREMTVCIASADGRATVVKTKDGKDCLYIKMAGTPASLKWFSTSGKDGFGPFFTDATELEQATLDETTPLYFMHGNRLHYVSPDGRLGMMEEKMTDIAIADGHYVCMRRGGNLYLGKLQGSSVGKMKKIVSGAESFACSEMQNFIYYTKDRASYCYNTLTEETVRFRDDPFVRITVSADGTSALFFTDPERVADGRDIGRLYYWKTGDEKATLLSEKAVMQQGFYGGTAPLSQYVGGQYFFYEAAGRDYDGTLCADGYLGFENRCGKVAEMLRIFR